MNTLKSLAAVVALLCVGTLSHAAVIEVRLTDDQRLFDYEAVSDGAAPSQGVSNDLRVGTSVVSATNPRLPSAILPFPLPAVDPNDITSATLTVMIADQNAANLPRADQFVDLYGLPFDDQPDVDITNDRQFSGANDTTTGVVKLQENYLTPAHAAVAGTLVTSIDITDYLKSLYAGGAVAGDFAVLRLSDDNPDGTVLQRYRFRSSGGTGAANPESEKPVLTITVVPEPGGLALLGLGGLGLLRRRRQA